MKFKTGIETEISTIESEISHLQARLQQIKDFEAKAAALLDLAKEIAAHKQALAGNTFDVLAEDLMDILDPIEPEPEPEQSPEGEPESEPLAIGTKVKSIYSEGVGTIAAFKEAPAITKYKYQYTVVWEKEDKFKKPTFWDAEILPLPVEEHKQLTIDEAIQAANNSQDFISCVVPKTGETFKQRDLCYIPESGTIWMILDIPPSENDLKLWVQILNEEEGKLPSFLVPPEEVLIVQQLSDTIYQCSDGTVLLNCSKKHLALGWEQMLILKGYTCKLIKLNKLWRLEIQGLSKEGIAKLIEVHTSVDTPCPDARSAAGRATA